MNKSYYNISYKNKHYFYMSSQADYTFKLILAGDTQVGKTSFFQTLQDIRQSRRFGWRRACAQKKISSIWKLKSLEKGLESMGEYSANPYICRQIV